MKTRWGRVTRIPHEGKTPPITFNTQKHERFLNTLLSHTKDLEKTAKPILHQAADKDKNIIAMALNQGDLDMLVNFVCSAKKHDMDISPIVVFGGDEVVVNVARALGLHAFTHKAFGNLPKEHAVQ